MTKHLLTLLFTCLSGNLSSQWSDSFSDHDFKSNPTWMGDTTLFTVNPSLQLQLNAPSQPGSANLSTLSQFSCNATWTFWIKMDFNPSSENYAKVFLMSDKTNFNEPLNGYFLRIGYSNDDLCLFRQEGTTLTLIADGRDKIFNTTLVNARIEVKLDDDGNWKLWCDTTGGTNYSMVAQGKDNVRWKSASFGFQCIYTSTRSTRFFFDDIAVSGEVYVDKTKPRIQSQKYLSDHSLELTFTENLDTSANNELNYSIAGNSIKSAYYNSENNTVVITSGNPFLCGSDNIMEIKGITDMNGMVMNDTTLRFQYCEPNLYDVVFNEIMADPDPPNQIPNAEYLEIYNRTSKTFQLFGWHLTVGSNSFVFPEITMLANSYLLVCHKSNEGDFSKYGKTSAIFTSATSLNNTGQFLKLEDAYGHLLSWVDYNDSWYADDYKSQGGWSLEQIDPANPCGGKTNWKVSNSGSGGTPGSKNSVYHENPDVSIPEVLHLGIPADSLVDISFSEPMDTSKSMVADFYKVMPDIGHPKYCKNVENHLNTVRLVLPRPLVRSEIYTFLLSRDVTDCVGNQFSSETELPLEIPSSPDSASLVINEVLFNCKTGGAEYIELYNRSEKTLNARQILIGTKANGQPQNLCRLSETGYLLYPNTFTLVTSNIQKVKAFYHVENEKSAVELAALPSLDDKSSTIVLLNDTMGRIDEFTYSEGMHMATLKNTDGIALERVSPNKAANFPCNWHSASAGVGYGTPGYQNSQYLKDSVVTSDITLSYEIFSPDNDGFRDQLEVCYKFDKPGCRAQVFLYSPSGRLVRHLFTNELLGTKGSFTWDGMDDKGKICQVGMYLVFIRTVFADGSTDEYKKNCILATKK